MGEVTKLAVSALILLCGLWPAQQPIALTSGVPVGHGQHHSEGRAPGSTADRISVDRVTVDRVTGTTATTSRTRTGPSGRPAPPAHHR